MNQEQIDNILNRLNTLETQNTSQDVKSLQQQINDLNFKAYGRDGLKNLKKTWIDFIKPTLGTGVNNNLGVTLEDAADDTAEFNFMIPRDLSPLFYELVWSGMFPGSAGNVYIKGKIGSGQKGETGLARTSVGSYFTLACLADYKLNYTDLKDFGLDLTVMKKDDYVNIEIERDATNGSDDLNTGIIIHGLKITYV
jgi:hypothetical protein